MRFLKKFVPKKLSIKEIWSLYQVLGKSRGKEFLMDEILELVKVSTPEGISASIDIMYKSKNRSHEDIVVMFIDGLKDVKFFDFQQLVGSINGNR